MTGKGDTPRPYDAAKFRSEWERIFSKPQWKESQSDPPGVMECDWSITCGVTGKAGPQ